mmetsp:Transcript_21018/g.47116  ORF Transcript_21018/g.47116 Transcript_21018/m.47116 type:complete len:448 (+) Transcript_21018:1526-2869(+)
MANLAPAAALDIPASATRRRLVANEYIGAEVLTENLSVPATIFTIDHVATTSPVMVIGQTHPRVLQIAVSTVPPRMVRPPAPRRRLHPPLRIVIPAHHRPLLRNQPHLAIATGKQELVEPHLVEAHRPGVRALSVTLAAVGLGTAKLVSGGVPMVTFGDVTDQAPAAATKLRAIRQLPGDLEPDVDICSDMVAYSPRVPWTVSASVNHIGMPVGTPVVCDTDPRVLRVSGPAVPPRPVGSLADGRPNDPPVGICVPPVHRVALGNKPLLAISSGKQELVERNAIETDGPGVGADLRPLAPVGLGTAETVGGGVPPATLGGVAHKLPATPGEFGAIGNLDSLLANKYISSMMRPNAPAVTTVATFAVDHLCSAVGAVVVGYTDPRVFSGALSTVPASLVAPPTAGRLIDPPGGIRIPSEDRVLFGHQPLLAVAGRQEELIKFGSVKSH